MRRLFLALGMLALVVPVAATAKRSPPPGKSATNVAHLCKDLRAANPLLFKQVWGTNTNHRNAYGKCVSARARAKHHPVTFTLHNLTFASSGTVTSAGAAGCQFTAAGCTVTTSGAVSGAFVGTYSSSF